MERRHFLGAVVSAVAITLLPEARGRETPPRLWGDGIHDDSYALQWRIDRSTAQSPVCSEKRHLCPRSGNSHRSHQSHSLGGEHF